MVSSGLVIAFECIALDAIELGLGTCRRGAFNEEKVKKMMKISANKRVFAYMALVYLAEKT